VPTYEFRCDTCSKDFEITMTIRERAATRVTCPHCDSETITPQMAAFSAKTSRKS
jgi:putative FmdB family regulatory protein